MAGLAATGTVAARPQGRARRSKLDPSETFLRNFAITTSGVNWDPPLQYNLEVLGPDRVMFAVDYPYQETHEAADWIRTAAIPEDVRRQVASGNAERIFHIARQEITA